MNTSLTPYLTEAARREAWLRLENILYSLPVAKAAGKTRDKFLAMERRLAAELIKQWRETYGKALTDIFRAIPDIASQQAMDILFQSLSDVLGPAFGSSPAIQSLMKSGIQRAYRAAKSQMLLPPEPGKSSVALSLPDLKAINVLTRHNCYWLGQHYGKAIRPKIAKLTQAALDEGLGRGELAELLRRALGSSAPGGYTYWDVVASSAIVRSRSFGALSGMEEAGITEYEILAMGDERMCPICGDMNGRIFSVAETRRVVDRVLDIANPEAFKAAMPWQTTPPAGRSNAELLASGQSLPPFHGRCRCIMVMAGESVAEVPVTPTPEPVDEAAAIRTKVEELQAKDAKLLREYNDLEQKIQDAARAGDVAAYNALLAQQQKTLGEGQAVVKELLKAKIEAAEKGVIFASELAKTLDKTDVDAIIKAVEAAPEDVRKVWNLHEDLMKVTDKAFQGGVYNYDGDRGVRFDIADDRKMTAEHRPFKTLFHELGHSMDHASGGFSSYRSTFFDGGAFGDTLRKEGERHIADRVKQFEANLVQRGYTPEQAKSLVPMDRIYNTISQELRTIPDKDRREVSDIFHGITKCKVDGGWGHYEPGYWENPDSLPKEAFAHFMCADISNAAALQNIKNYFPQSFSIFKEMLREIIEEVENS